VNLGHFCPSLWNPCPHFLFREQYFAFECYFIWQRAWWPRIIAELLKFFRLGYWRVQTPLIVLWTLAPFPRDVCSPAGDHICQLWLSLDLSHEQDSPAHTITTATLIIELLGKGAGSWCERCLLITESPKTPGHYRYQNRRQLIQIGWCCFYHFVRNV